MDQTTTSAKLGFDSRLWAQLHYLLRDTFRAAATEQP